MNRERRVTKPMDGDPRTMFSHEFKRGLETSQHCFGDELLLSLGIRGLELLYLVVFDDPAARVQLATLLRNAGNAGKEMRLGRNCGLY